MQTVRPGHRWVVASWVALAIMGGFVRTATAQIPAPRGEAQESSELVDRREAIFRGEEAKRLEAKLPARGGNPVLNDGSSRFVPLDEVVEPSVNLAGKVSPAERALRLDSAGKLFDLAMVAAKSPEPPLAFIDECLRGVLDRQPDHAEARRLLGFIPHGKGGWATPFAASELAGGKVKDPTFGWVPADWVPHLQRGELPALPGSNRWLPQAEADELRLRRPCKNGWEITTEHFVIHANLPLSGVIAFGRQLETLHEVFFAVMADLIGPERLPLALRLAKPKLQPTWSNNAPKHQVYDFATREEYIQYLAPIGGSARESLGIYLPKKEAPPGLGRVSYFFNDVGGQLDVTTTLYHEVSHQLLFESAGPEGYTRNSGNYWVFEGLGTYFETLQFAEDGSLRVGGLVGPRLAQARERLIDRKELIPLDQFVAMGRGAFQGDGGGDIYLNYAEAMALSVFLMQDRHREAFLDYARDAYKGQLSRGGQGQPLDKRLAQKYPDLQREVLDHLGRLAPPPRQAAAAER